MNAKTRKLIASLQAELASAIATKNAANEAGNECAFDAAIARVRAIEDAISSAERAPRGYVCPIMRDRVKANID